MGHGQAQGGASPSSPVPSRSPAPPGAHGGRWGGRLQGRALRPPDVFQGQRDGEGRDEGKGGRDWMWRVNRGPCLGVTDMSLAGGHRWGRGAGPARVSG